MELMALLLRIQDWLGRNYIIDSFTTFPQLLLFEAVYL
jgi:hypothetical protein